MKVIINSILFLFLGIAIYSQEPGWKFSYLNQIFEKIQIYIHIA